MEGLRFVTRALFFAATVLMLAYILTHIEEKDADIVFIAAMTALTFPIGLIVTLLMAALLGLVLLLFGFQFNNSLPFYFLVWLTYAITGYWQWFHVVPAIRRKRAAIHSSR